MPFFSVIISLYNKEDYIERALDSVLSQDFSDYEVIIVDDGSTDNGPRLVENYQDERINFVCQSNSGGAGAGARNKAMQIAVGDCFAFLDADDAWMPAHLSTLKKAFISCPDAGLVSTATVELNEGDSFENPSRAEVEPKYINYFHEASKKIQIVQPSSAAIRREVWVSCGEFSILPTGPDLEFWARIAVVFPVAHSALTTSAYYRGNMGNMEKLAVEREASSISSSRISLKEISPSVRYLASYLEQNPQTEQRASIVEYINSRIVNSIKSRLARDKVYEAKNLGYLLLKENVFAYLTKLFFTVQPNKILYFEMVLYKKLSYLKVFFASRLLR